MTNREIIMFLMLIFSIILFSIMYKNAEKKQRDNINKEWIRELGKRKVIAINKDGGFSWND
jgi:hypothetical protein